jgi:hypothetical protein
MKSNKDKGAAKKLAACVDALNDDDFEDADKYFEDLKTEDVALVKAVLGRLRIGQERSIEARQLFEDGLSLAYKNLGDSHQYIAQYCLAFIAASQEDRPQAALHIDLALALEPDELVFTCLPLYPQDDWRH